VQTTHIPEVDVMCEMLAVTAPPGSPPIAIPDLLRWARLLDELGVAGYGWGLAWVDGAGLHRYRSLFGVRRDPYADEVLAGVTTRRLFIHLRRPSLMTSQSQVNAQPYHDPDLSTAFAHNGYLEHHRDLRPRYQGKLQGTSDSEVGFQRWLEALTAGEAPGPALRSVHEELGGKANLMALLADGTLLTYAGNPENPCVSFRLPGLSLVATSLHSLDDYLFQAIFPEATAIEPIPVGTVRELP
jgi:predicted glutamine amidotransferase